MKLCRNGAVTYVMLGKVGGERQTSSFHGWQLFRTPCASASVQVPAMIRQISFHQMILFYRLHASINYFAAMTTFCLTILF